jgi:hypothetical protein
MYLANQQFIDKLKAIYGETYDYSAVKYMNNHVKVDIICKKHGAFKQRPDHLYTGIGCQKCSAEKVEENIRAKMVEKREEFIENARKIYGDRYDYSQVKYSGNKTPVEIICCKHGAFMQFPETHLKSFIGCPSCRGEHTGNRCKIGREKTIARFVEKHGDRFDYSKVVYKNNKTPIEIVCKLHGLFFQTPETHLHGITCCPVCTGHTKFTTEEVISKFVAVHGKIYDYSKVDYKGIDTKVEIVCRKHGSFMQSPDRHLIGQSCPKCHASHGERLVSKLLDESGVRYKHQKTLASFGYKERGKLSLDFYIPSLNCAIEYQGAQHYSAIRKWGGLEGFEKQRERDEYKRKFCFEQGIVLIEIPYTTKDDEVSEIIKRLTAA